MWLVSALTLLATMTGAQAIIFFIAIIGLAAGNVFYYVFLVLVIQFYCSIILKILNEKIGNCKVLSGQISLVASVLNLNDQPLASGISQICSNAQDNLTFKRNRLMLCTQKSRAELKQI